MTPPTYTKKPDSECNKPCKKDKKVMCGGGWRNSVYTNNYSYAADIKEIQESK